MREADETVQDLWRRYKASGSVELRNDLVLSYLSLVRYVAARTAAGMPPEVERNDLISYGTIGLIDAITKFDLDKGVKFETYAITRIRGEIIDQLRGQDRVPRSVRSKAKALAVATAELESELGRMPDDQEVAEHLGLDLAGLWALQRDAAVAAVIPLDEHDGDDDRPSLRETIHDVTANPGDRYGSEYEIVELVASAVDTLPPRFKMLLTLYYLEELTLAGIGEVLGVTESRVCQLQGRLLELLRDSLANGAAATAA